jgi:hypothetical protein
MLGDDERAVDPGGASVSIVQDASVYRAELVFTGALSGRRRLSGYPCPALADAVLLCLALAANPIAVVHYVADAERAQHVTALAERDALHFLVGVRFGADVGSLPKLAVGPGLWCAKIVRRLRRRPSSFRGPAPSCARSSVWSRPHRVSLKLRAERAAKCRISRHHGVFRMHRVSAYRDAILHSYRSGIWNDGDGGGVSHGSNRRRYDVDSEHRPFAACCCRASQTGSREVRTQTVSTMRRDGSNPPRSDAGSADASSRHARVGE